MFCGFFWKLIYDFYLSKTTVQNCNLAGRGRVPTFCSGGNHGDVYVALAARPAGAFACTWIIGKRFSGRYI